MGGRISQLVATFPASSVSRSGARCIAKSLWVEIDHAFEVAPAFGVLLMPCGIGMRREMQNPRMLDFLPEQV